MENINNLGTISKEVLTILSYCDEDIINKVPNSLIKELVNYAGGSKVECFLLPEKKLEEQNISKEAKDLISLIYYSYIANQEEKREIEKIWYKNENKYQEELSNKYNIDNLFKTNAKQEEVQLIKYENDNAFIKFFKKLLEKIKDKLK